MSEQTFEARVKALDQWRERERDSNGEEVEVWCVQSAPVEAIAREADETVKALTAERDFDRGSVLVLVGERDAAEAERDALRRQVETLTAENASMCDENRKIIESAEALTAARMLERLAALDERDALSRDYEQASLGRQHAEAEVETLRAGWQPIETAPKDGRSILVWSSQWRDGGKAATIGAVASWSSLAKCFVMFEGAVNQPEVWHALPAPPKAGE